jgi:predicted NUDIX family phosphoesterase
MDKMKQKVLCINSDTLFENIKWNGLLKTDLEFYYSLLIEKSEFRIRSELEKSTDYKQLITQVILKYKNKYFLG